MFFCFLRLSETFGDLLILSSDVKYACVTERKEVSKVNSDQSESLIKELCETGQIDEALEKYILGCSANQTPAQDDAALSDGNSNQKKSKKQDVQKSAFPNLAGFCRYLGIGTDEIENIMDEYPREYGRILAALEDEALNSGLSPTLISAYLKKRLRYDTSQPKSSYEGQMQIRFEHDIFEDGE